MLAEPEEDGIRDNLGNSAWINKASLSLCPGPKCLPLMPFLRGSVLLHSKFCPCLRLAFSKFFVSLRTPQVSSLCSTWGSLEPQTFCIPSLCSKNVSCRDYQCGAEGQSLGP